MTKKRTYYILIVLVVLAVIYISNEFNNSSTLDSAKKPHIFINNDVYWHDNLIDIIDFNKLEQSNINSVGTTTLVQTTPQNEGEAYGIEDGLEILYDNTTDTVYVFYELSQPQKSKEEGYMSFSKIE